jgi:hypothetical protein
LPAGGDGQALARERYAVRQDTKRQNEAKISLGGTSSHPVPERNALVKFERVI